MPPMYAWVESKNAKHGVSFELVRRLISTRPPPGSKEPAMRKPYTQPMTPAEIAATPDRDIDSSDIPELDEAFWQNAQLIEPDRTQPVTLRIKKSVLEAYKAQGKGYQTRMNSALETYANTLTKPR